MRTSRRELSPPMVVALVSIALILLGFIAFMFINARSGGRDGDLNIDPRSATPAAVSVNVTQLTSVPTVQAPPTATSAPLATLPPTSSLAPTATPAPPPTAPAPTPTPPLPVEPPPAAGAQPPAQSAQEQPAPPAAAAPPPAGALPPPGQPPSAPNPIAPQQPPPQAPIAQPEPSESGGFGNTQRDLQAVYGPPVGRTADGLEIFQTERAQIEVAFRGSRAERLRVVPRNDRRVSLDEARALSKVLLPRDAQPLPARDDQPAQPVDQYRSAALAQVFDLAAFRGAPPGSFFVSFTRLDGDRFSGFEIVLGAPSG